MAELQFSIESMNSWQTLALCACRTVHRDRETLGACRLKKCSFSPSKKSATITPPPVRVRSIFRCYSRGDPHSLLRNKKIGRSCNERRAKRSQFFIGTRNEALSIAAMRVSNPDRSPLESSPAISCPPWNKWQRQSQKRDGQLPNTEQGYGVPFTLIASQ